MANDEEGGIDICDGETVLVNEKKGMHYGGRGIPLGGHSVDFLKILLLLLKIEAKKRTMIRMIIQRNSPRRVEE